MVREIGKSGYAVDSSITHLCTEAYGNKEGG